MSKTLPEWRNEKDVLQRALLETVYWWMDNENEDHKLFSRGVVNYKADKKQFEGAFYDFTKNYSVRRTISGEGQDPANKILELLMKGYNEIQSGSKDLDEYGSSVRSLVSKFATLVNPISYSMYDGNAAIALSNILYGRKTSAFSDYKSYLKGFNEFKRLFVDSIPDEEIAYWREGFLCKKFNVDPEICTRNIFLGRLTDKFLWCYYDMKLKKVKLTKN